MKLDQKLCMKQVLKMTKEKQLGCLLPCWVFPEELCILNLEKNQTKKSASFILTSMHQRRHRHGESPERKLICVFCTVQRNNTSLLTASEDEMRSSTVVNWTPCRELLYIWPVGMQMSIGIRQSSCFASSRSARQTVLTVWHDAAPFKIWRWVGMTAAVVSVGATGPTGTLDPSTMLPGCHQRSRYLGSVIGVEWSFWKVTAEKQPKTSWMFNRSKLQVKVFG